MATKNKTLAQKKPAAGAKKPKAPPGAKARNPAKVEPNAGDNVEVVVLKDSIFLPGGRKLCCLARIGGAAREVPIVIYFAQQSDEEEKGTHRVGEKLHKKLNAEHQVFVALTDTDSTNRRTIIGWALESQKLELLAKFSKTERDAPLTLTLTPTKDLMDERPDYARQRY